MVYDGNPLISIIVPVYNVEDYLNNTLTSIVSQTYRNLEIILVDDGSTDSSGAMCDEWATKDPRIRVIHQENNGLSCARNVGLDFSTGEFILFSDSDDVMSLDLCQILLDSITPEVHIAICDILHIFPDQPYSFRILPEHVILDAHEVIRQMWYQTGILPSACAKLYRKAIFDSHRFTPGISFEDIDLLHELFWTSQKVVYTPSQLYGYVHRSGGITARPFSVHDLDILNVSQKLLHFSEDKPSLIKPAQAYAVTAAFRIYLNAPRTPEYSAVIDQAQSLIRQYGCAVLSDPCTRKKNRYALLLYYFCKPLLRSIYPKINRWN